jgi:hypothetical protein
MPFCANPSPAPAQPRRPPCCVRLHPSRACGPPPPAHGPGSRAASRDARPGSACSSRVAFRS